MGDGALDERQRQSAANALLLRADGKDNGLTISGDSGSLAIVFWGHSYNITNKLDKAAAQLARDYIDEWLKR